MNIIINASNLRVGGAIQVALSVFNELYAHTEHHFHLFLSPAFDDLIDEITLKQDNISFYRVNFPSRFSLSGRVKQLDELEAAIYADCVFSIFGPNYWKPTSPHMIGFAQGYYIYNDLPFFKTLDIIKNIKLTLLKSYHRFLLKNHAQRYVVESYDVRMRLSQYLDVGTENIHVAANTYSGYFYAGRVKNLVNTEEPFKLLTIAYPYPHKNLLIFKEVSDILNANNLNYVFHITVPEDYYKKNFSGYERSIFNLGVVKNKDCPKLYEKCDAMILPSLVECFSASYPEAMVMRRPILTSDYSFARSVCGDAALYFDALNPKDIAEKVQLLSSDNDVYHSVVSAGVERLNDFLSPKERCKCYVDFLVDMVRQNV